MRTEMKQTLIELIDDEVATAVAVEIAESVREGHPADVRAPAGTAFLSGFTLGLRFAQRDDRAARSYYAMLREDAWGEDAVEIGANDDAKLDALAAVVERGIIQ